MRIKDLIDHLAMFPEDMEVYISTTPSDLCQPVTRKAFKLLPAWIDERSKMLEQAKLVLIAFFPSEKNT